MRSAVTSLPRSSRLNGYRSRGFISRHLPILSVSLVLGAAMLAINVGSLSRRANAKSPERARGIGTKSVAGLLNEDGRIRRGIDGGLGASIPGSMAGASSSSFDVSQQFATATSPRIVAAGDLNGDGLLDLVTANKSDSNLSVLLNTTAPGASTLTFAAKQDFATGASPQFVAFGDLNGDGSLDLVVANGLDNTVSVFLNTTAPGAVTLSFALERTFAVGANPTAALLGDLNGDGNLDLAVANADDSTVSVLLNTTAPGSATPSFASQQTFATGVSPQSLSIGDLNGDGTLDLVTANGQDNTVSVLLNVTAPGAVMPSFATAQNFAAGQTPATITMGDLNGDGLLDLAITNQVGDNVSVLLNTTAPGAVTVSFAKQDIAIGASPLGITLGDVNGDGRLDLAVTNLYANTVSVALNTTAPGAVTPSFATPQDYATGALPAAVLLNDLNGDGKLDLVVANYLSNSVSVLLNTFDPDPATPGFTAAQNFAVGSNADSVTAGDLNGDGRLDLVVTNRDSNTVSVLLNASAPGAATPSFATQQTLATGSGPLSITVGDLNGDGRLDLVVANQGDNTVSALLNTTAPGAAISSFAIAQDFATGPVPASVTLGDLNGDGSLDLVVTNVADNTISILLNTTAPGAANPSFATQQTFAVGSGPASITVGDLNGDGRLDLVVTNQDDNTVSVLLNTSAPGATILSLATAQSFATGSGPGSVTLGDLNGDGLLDLAVAGVTSGTVSVLLNTTAPGADTATFASSQSFATGNSPASVAVGDLNGDGKLDLAVANQDDNTVSVLRNTTAPGAALPSFATHQDFATDFFPSSVVLGDMNGDGKLDLAVANASADTVSVLLNTPTIVATTGLSRQQGEAASNSQIATVTDYGGDGNVIVTVTSGNPDHDVTISNIVDTGGNITADIVADCPGANATFTLQASDGSSIVTDTLTVNVTANASVTPTITPGGPTTFCTSGSVTLTSSSASGNQWYLNNNPIGGATNQTYVATASGDYTVTDTSSGCASTPSSVTTVTVNPIPATPSITPGGPTTFCTGGSVTLTSNSMTGNQWYLDGNPIGGATNQAYIATASGDYTNTVTTTGCTSAPASATTVTVNPIPATPTITPVGPATLCPAGNVTLTSSSGTGNQWLLNGNPIGGATAQQYEATAAGTYTVTVTTVGCDSAPSMATTVTANVAPTLTYASPQSVAFAGSMTVNTTSSSGAITGYAVQSVVPALTTAPTVDASGAVSITDAQTGGAHNITIRATDSCGVTVDASFMLNVSLTTTYADPAGSCGGNAPCFTTIQAAINALTSAGTVNVGGGTFSEDVNVTTDATLNLNADTTVNSLTMSGGTLNGSNGGSFTLTLASGDWTNNGGTFNPGTGTVSFAGTGQVIGGTNPTTFNNLTIGAGGTTANGASPGGGPNAAISGPAPITVDETVTGVLTLTGDLTVADPARLIMPASASSAGTGDVIGNVERTGFVSNECASAPCFNTLSFGNPDNQITLTGGTAPTSILVNLAKAAPATFTTAVHRNYTLTETGGSGFTVTLRLHYLDSELNSNTPESALNLRRFNGTAWVPFAPTVPVDTTNNWVENNAVTSFSTWTFSTFSPTAANGVVSGRITTSEGKPVEGTVVRLSGERTRKLITDAGGNYRFDNVDTGGFYTVTPSRANFNFNPFNRSFSQTGNQTEAVFTADSIGDNANPLDSAEYFVRQQYVDVLGREPDEAGFNYWSDQILACGADASCISAQRTGVAAAFFIENEAQQTGSYIYDVYAGALGRRPAFGEYTADRKQVVGGDTLDTAKTVYAQNFVQRSVFTAKYQGALTAESFVEALIQNGEWSGGNISGERAHLISTYNQATDLVTSRAAVIRSLADNATFKQSQYNQAFVLTEYFSYLRRDIDQNGYNFWVSVLNTVDVHNYRGMVCSFTTSLEYQNRFSSVSTHSNSECSAP